MMFTFLFEENFAPYYHKGELIIPQVTLLNAGDTFGAIKGYWEHNTMCDWYRESVRLYECGQGFVVADEEEVLVLQFTGTINRFTVKWVSVEEVLEVIKDIFKVEFANGFCGEFLLWDEVLAYERKYNTKAIKCWYGTDFGALFE